MSYTLGPASVLVQAQCHKSLQRLINELIQYANFAVREGYRDPAAQQSAFDAGLARAKPGQSKHNMDPSQAVHLIPYPPPVPGGTTERLEYTLFAGRVLQQAAIMGINLRWGGDWNQNDRVADNHFNDLQHYELVTT